MIGGLAPKGGFLGLAMIFGSDSSWNAYCLVAGVALTSLVALRKYRSAQWGYYVSSKSLLGRTIIVTGGNSGLGYHTSLQLAKARATVILACRSRERGNEAVNHIRSLTKNQDVHFVPLDLASLESIQEFSQNVVKKFPKIDCLVCNAGLWKPMDQGCRTQDGYEIHFGVNHLGHYLLGRSLMKPLQNSPDGRIVFVSSSLMKNGQINLDQRDFIYVGRQQPGKKSKYGSVGYNDSKLMNALMAKQMALLAPNQVGVYSVSPGWCYTELFRGTSFLKKIMVLPIGFLFMRSAWRGAHNILKLVYEDKDQLQNGGFYSECQLSVKDNQRLDSLTTEAEGLSKLSDDLVKQYLIQKRPGEKHSCRNHVSDAMTSPPSSPSDDGDLSNDEMMG
eukprot:snap_masked-scaffold689_size110969-processed-gene-0.2 protein:Tk07318 transcript:snap_masked-scaffold689_size110969-processed-gene-0.2-mRNA-1 annotation:"retinol dehydrogenase 12"